MGESSRDAFERSVRAKVSERKRPHIFWFRLAGSGPVIGTSLVFLYLQPWLIDFPDGVVSAADLAGTIVGRGVLVTSFIAALAALVRVASHEESTPGKPWDLAGKSLSMSAAAFAVGFSLFALFALPS